jgi:hypothetical protein
MPDIFELSLKLTAAGLAELQAGLERVNALGGEAAGALTQMEQASASLAAANTAGAGAAGAANAASTALGVSLAQVAATAQQAAAGAQEVQSGFGVAAPSVATMVDLITQATTGFGSVSTAAREAASAQAEITTSAAGSAETLDAWDAVLIRSADGLAQLGAIQAEATAALQAGAITEQDLADITAELTARYTQLYGTQQAGRLTNEETAAAEAQVAGGLIGVRVQAAGTENTLLGLSGAAKQVRADFAAGLITEEEKAKALAQIRAEAIALRQELATLSGPGLGNFNQILRATATETGVATGALEGMNTRGLFQVARGMAFMEAASVGAGRGVSQLALGALLFSGGTWVAVAALAALGIGVGVYDLLTEAQRKLNDQFEAAGKTFADAKSATDALGTAYEGLAFQIDRAATAQERLSTLTTPSLAAPGAAESALGRTGAALFTGAEAGSVAGPLGATAGAITALIGVRHEEAEATDAQTAAQRAQNAVQVEQIAQYQKEAATLREQIALGQNVDANRQRLRETEQQLTAAVQGHVAAVQQQNLAVFGQVASIPELIAARRREIDTILAQVQSTGTLDDATKKHLASAVEALATLEKAYGHAGDAAKLMADDAKAAAALIAETGKVFGETAADLSLLFDLGLISASKLVAVEKAYAEAAKNTNLPLEQRRQAHQASQQIEQLLLSTERDRLTVIANLAKGDGLSAAAIKQLTAEYTVLQRVIETGLPKAAAQAAGQQDAVRKAIAAPLEGAIQTANQAAESIKALGATAGNLSALRSAVGALTGLTDDDNRALLESVGLEALETQALKARTAAVQALAAATEVMNEAEARRAPPSFGLGGVSTGPTGAPITFGQGISLAPAAQAALIPERPLTPEVPFGAGLQAPLIPNNFFDQAIQNLQQGFDRIRAATRTGVRAVSAETAHLATDLAKQFESAFQSAFVSIAASIGTLIGRAFAGVSTAGFGKEILAALGGLFVRMGEAMIAASPIFKALAAAMSNPFTAGPALLAYGAALVALGSLLGAIATGGSSGASAGSGAASNVPIRVIVVDSATRAAAGVQQPQPFVWTGNNYGDPTDPRSQRWVTELQRQAGRRNLPIGT